MQQQQLKTVIVTGSNKGIGFGIIENISKKPYHIIMACRSVKRAQETKQKIVQQNPLADQRIDILELDVSQSQSIDQFVKNISQKYGQIDILVNNAGIAVRGQQFDENSVGTTLQTNFFGTTELTEKMLPYIKEYGKIIFIGSQTGKLNLLKTKHLYQCFTDENLDRTGLYKLAYKYIDDVKNKIYEKEGWSQFINGYGVSKLLINTYARVASKFPEIIKQNIQVYTCCVGWVKTDMAGQQAELTIEQGVVTPCYLIDLPHQVNKEFQGKYFYKCKVDSL